MLYAINCTDRADGKTLRAVTRAAHLDYVKSAGQRLIFAGPYLSDAEKPEPVGSLIVIKAESLAAARLFAQNDPYARAGLFDAVDVKPLKPVLGPWADAISEEQ